MMRLFVLRAAMAALVLALGVALGAGPLQENNERRARALTAQQQKLADRDREIAELTRSGDFGSAYAEATSGLLIRGALSRRTVALVRLPGADAATVASIRKLVVSAGGEIAATVPLSASVAKPSERQLVAALTSQMATQESLRMPDGGSGYERFGVLLARSIGVPSSGRDRDASYDETALGILSGFQTAELIETAAAVTRRAFLTLVITGPQATESGETDVLATIIRGYAEQARVVVAGPTAAAGRSGVLGLLRGKGTPAKLVSTVDSVELVSGQVSAVLALAARVRGTVGSYGGVGAEDGAVPAVP